MSFTKTAENILSLAKDLDARAASGSEPMAAENVIVRYGLVDATRNLLREALTPYEYLMDVAMAASDHLGLRAVARYDVPNLVPDTGTPTPIAAIAEKTPISEESLTRLLRSIMTHGIFAEPAPGLVTHTPVSRAMRDRGYQGFITLLLHHQQAFDHAIEALERIGKVAPTQESPSGFTIAYPDDKGPFDRLAKLPGQAELVAAAFATLFKETMATDGLLSSKVWDEIDGPGAQVIDVGGGAGHLSVAIADKATKECTFIVQDRPETVKGRAEALPGHLKSRVSYMAHDFFTEQPVKGADVYFLRSVLHDWPDARCVDIIRSIVPALKPGARIVVNERIPAATGGTGWKQRNHRYADLAMMATFNAKERDETAWRELFVRADARFKLEFEHWEGSIMSVIHAVWS